MSGLFGGANITNSETRLGALQVQQSSQGVPIALLWGRNRISNNLLWFDDFQAIENRTSENVGKGGGTTVTNVTYTYRASLLMGLAAGVCTGVPAVWRNKDKITATSRVLPGDQLSHIAILPGDKTVTVPRAAEWDSTSGVFSVVDSGEGYFESATSDYTNPSDGVYVFGASLAVGARVRIAYATAPVVENLSALQVAGFSWFGNGALGQAVWPYLTTAHPTEAIGYSGVCYVAASGFLLGGAAGLPQLAFEVDGPRQVGGGNVDASAADIVTDLLTAPVYSAGFPSASLADMTTFRAWCAAAGLWFSPVWTERKGVFEYLQQIARLTHSRALWSVDTLRMVPMATDPLTSGTGSYTPAPEHGAPVYAITDDDIKDPIEETRSAPADRFNRVSLRYKNREQDYAEAIESAEDRAGIDAFGLIEAPEVMSAPEIALPSVAATVSELLLREYMTSGGQYRFTLPVSYDLLEPLDIIQIEDERINLSARSVRVLEIGEVGDDGSLSITAEDVRTTGAVIQTRQAGGGFAYSGGPPDAATLRAIMMPTALTSGAQELWIGMTAGPNWGGATLWVSQTGLDYQRVADVPVRARLGTLAASLASASVEVNPTQTTSLSLTGSTTLAGVSQADVDSALSLTWVNGELLAFRDATLSAPATYDLEYLRRGLYGTPMGAQSIGAPWMRLDSSVVKLPVAEGDIGKTLYVKVVSRNALGTYVQGLDEVAAVPVLLVAQPSAPDAPGALALTTPFVGTYFDVNWAAAARASDYEIEVEDTVGAVVMRTIYTSAQSLRYLFEDAVSDGDAKRAYTVRVRGRNTGGNGPWATLLITNAAPATTTGVGTSGSGTSRTVTWDASAATDLGGYLARFSTTTGFDPTAGEGTAFYTGPDATADLTGLTPGTDYYVRVAAFDVWDQDIADLNWSAQHSFTA